VFYFGIENLVFLARSVRRQRNVYGVASDTAENPKQYQMTNIRMIQTRGFFDRCSYSFVLIIGSLAIRICFVFRYSDLGLQGGNSLNRPGKGSNRKRQGISIHPQTPTDVLLGTSFA